MKHQDVTQMSKEELINLVLSQTDQVAKLQLEIEVLNVKLNRNTLSEDSPQPSVIFHKENAPDQLNLIKSGLPQVRNNHENGPTSPSAHSSDNKPKWMTKNRLQNCHTPKPK